MNLYLIKIGNFKKRYMMQYISVFHNYLLQPNNDEQKCYAQPFIASFLSHFKAMAAVQENAQKHSWTNEFARSNVNQVTQKCIHIHYISIHIK